MIIRMFVGCLLAALLIAGVVFVGNPAATADSTAMKRKKPRERCVVACGTTRRWDVKKCVAAGGTQRSCAAAANTKHRACVIGCTKRHGK